jgi:signal transduction histidine kinase
MHNTPDTAGNVKWEGFGASPSDNHRITILAVDDNEAQRYALVRSLREAGYGVLEAGSGSEALAKAAQLPDLVTLDVNLPDMLGFEVCRQIKSNPATAHIPVLHLSSTFVEPDARVQGLASGADAYLAEPIDRAELVATIAALLRLKNAETAARQQAELAEKARQELAELNATLEQRVSDRTAELKRANASLRELSVRVLQMQDEERKRIARELHDGMGQLIAAIKMNNALIMNSAGTLPPQAAKAMSENETFIAEILKSIRTISHLLHPPLLDETGLPSALRWYVDEFSQRSGIAVDLNCSSTMDRLPTEIETAVFRIVQECLGNVHRHSGSTTAAIDLNLDEHNVFLNIRDSGKGIPLERQMELKMGGGGVGIRGITERVARFGGELQIQSGSQGTAISATLPRNPAQFHKVEVA